MLTEPVSSGSRKRFQHVAPVLGQFIQEEHAVMRKRDLARAQASSPADDGGRGRAVMRRAKRPAPPFGDRRQGPRQRMQHRAFERLGVVERRQQSRQALREHALARARRSDQEQAVPARGRDLERALRAGLAAHVGQVRTRSPAGRQFASAREFEARAALESMADGGQRGRARDSRAPRDARFVGIRERARRAGAPSRTAWTAAASVPRTGRSSPDSDSSP